MFHDLYNIFIRDNKSWFSCFTEKDCNALICDLQLSLLQKIDATEYNSTR